MTQGSNSPLALHLQGEDGQGRGRKRQISRISQGLLFAECIGQQGLYSAIHSLLSHAQTLAATSHRDILSTCLPVSWTNRCLAGLANRPRLFSTVQSARASRTEREPTGVYSIQCLLHSEGHSQPHIPSASASSSGSPRRCLLLTFTMASTG